MIRHALVEGFILLRQRIAVSLGLALALAVPIGFAGVTWSVMRWLEPAVGLASAATVVPVLLHPHMDDEQRDTWLDEQRAGHPEWHLETISPEELADRLVRWFPYLDQLLEGDEAFLSPLVEITTGEPESVAELENSPAVIAVGPRSSISRSVGRAARELALALAATCIALLLAAAVFAAVWIHLELYRHADEITIMRLVGATESTIRGPFVVATLAPGVVATLLSVLATISIVQRLSGLTAVLGLPAVTVSPMVLAGQVLLGFALPLAASLITLAHHAATDFAD
jgi:cell division protein FtsX